MDEMIQQPAPISFAYNIVMEDIYTIYHIYNVKTPNAHTHILTHV